MSLVILASIGRCGAEARWKGLYGYDVDPPVRAQYRLRLCPCEDAPSCPLVNPQAARRCDRNRQWLWMKSGLPFRPCRSTGGRFPRNCVNRRGKRSAALSYLARRALRILPPRASRPPAWPCRATDKHCFRCKFDFVDGFVRGRSGLFAKHAIGADVTVRRPIKLGHIQLERMSRKLLDINLRWGGQALRPQSIESRLRPVGISPRWHATLCTRLV